MPADSIQIDSTVKIVTPENIAFRYQLAGPFRRFPAYLIDVAILLTAYVILWCVLMMVLSAALQGAGAAIGAGVGMVIWFLSTWLYGGVFETFMNGQTPGKRIMGIRVLTVNGQPINGLQAIMRNVFRFADTFPLISIQFFAELFPADAADMPPMFFIPTFLVGLFTMTLSKRFQRLGDLVCGTIVVIEERNWLAGIAKLDDPRAPQLASFLPGDFVVPQSMGRALATYVDRRRFFSLARRREVARHLGEPLIELFKLPSDTSHDLLLCALYYRTFVTDRLEEDSPRPVPPPVSNPYDPDKNGTVAGVNYASPLGRG